MVHTMPVCLRFQLLLANNQVTVIDMEFHACESLHCWAAVPVSSDLSMISFTFFFFFFFFFG
jgi:hypothetical protein